VQRPCRELPAQSWRCFAVSLICPATSRNLRFHHTVTLSWSSRAAQQSTAPMSMFSIAPQVTPGLATFPRTVRFNHTQSMVRSGATARRPWLLVARCKAVRRDLRVQRLHPASSSRKTGVRAQSVTFDPASAASSPCRVEISHAALMSAWPAAKTVLSEPITARVEF